MRNRSRGQRSVCLNNDSLASSRHKLAAAVRQTIFEQLERRQLMAANPVISEFVASNSTGLVDGNGAHSDWIEIHNAGDASIDLSGWHLTDDAKKPTKWTFPSYTLAAGAYMVVFADSTGTPDPAGNLNTNFSLSADGENLSLRQPDGTVVSEFGANGAAYPKQIADVSYGSSAVLHSTTLIGPKAAAKAIVPKNSSLDANQWTAVNYDDSTWKSGTTGVGFDGGGTASAANLLARWSAQSLNTLADGAAVSSWGVATGTGTATQSTSANQPHLIKNQINGRSLVHFDGVNDQLRVTNQSLNGATSFTVAVVFRTSTAGRTGSNWYDNTGIVDAEVGGVTNDWGVAMNDAGQIGAGVGNPDTTLYSAAGLNNGQAHVAIFTKSGTTTALSIDGGAPVYGTAGSGARTINQLVFGSINTNIQYFNGDIGEVRLYNAALSDDAVRSLDNEISTTWGLTPAAGVYTPQIGLDLQSDMSNAATTADIRVPFTVANASQFDKLTLNIKYDDGFVAYLNGTEVARRNAPTGSITYASTSTATRADSAALTAESIDLSSFVNLLQGNGATNVLAIKGLNSSLTDSDLLISPQLVASYSTAGTAYMTTPTPGAANQAGYAGLADPVNFSTKHGYYSAPISTVLTSTTPGSTIVYTLDGSDPTLENGTVVNSANSTSTPTTTLNISSTTVVRAATFKDGYLSSAITSESYFFVADIIHQPEGTPAGAYWDVGMDSDVVNNTSQTYSVAQALTAVPTISLVLPNEDMFGQNGIYMNPEEKGDAWERATSVEYFDPNNPSNEFSINAGVQVEGGVSRDPSRPKKSFTLSFKSIYGDSKLDYPLFGSTNPQQSFDHLVLRGGHSYSWANLGGEPVEQADYLRDEFARDTQIDLGGKAAKGNFVQLYINGQYWGLYNAVEEIDQTWAAANYGGNADNYDVIKPDGDGGIYADSGSLTAWNNLFNTADAAYADGKVDSTEYAAISKLVDPKALADYMLDVFYRGDNDAPVLIGSTTSPRNFIAVHNAGDPNGKFYFETWDGEISFTDVNYDRTEVFGDQNPGRLYQQLRTNPDFRQLMTDEIKRAFAANGPLSASANQARYQSLMNQINVAIVGESARWGNAKQTYVATRDVDWVNETNWIVNTYMPQRSNVVLNQLKADYPELSAVAPVVNVNGVASTGGAIASGSVVTLTDPSNGGGTIYYTFDGTDPRATGGSVSTSALAYSTAITVSVNRHILARTLTNGVWSSLTDVTLTTGVYPVRISEIHYHPAAKAGVTDPEDMEFVELYNPSSQAVSLQGVTISLAFDYTFPAGVTLAAGGRIVIARNSAVFQQVYGTSIALAPGAGYSTQNLSNKGEEIKLTGPAGETLEDFTYGTKAPWVTTPDGGGASLEMVDPTADPTNPANWRASFAVGGSPGTDGVVAPKVASNSSDYRKGYSVSFTFDHDMDTTSFAVTDVIVQLIGGSTFTPSSFTYTAATKTLMFNFASALPDGNYTATLSAGSVNDIYHTPLAAASAASFFALAGDVNHDRTVDIVDLGILSGNWQKNTGMDFSTGDVNNDGVVDIVDLGILSTNWQKTLAAPSATVIVKTPPKVIVPVKKPV